MINMDTHRAGGIPSTTHIAKHADRLKNLGTMSKHGGIVLVGVGLTAACMQIANTTDTKEKNEIFVETITSTAVGAGLGAVFDLQPHWLGNRNCAGSG